MTWRVGHENIDGKVYLSDDVPALMASPQKSEPFLVSAASSPGSADSTAASPELGFDTRSCVSRILGDEGCLPPGSPESPATTTSVPWGMADEMQADWRENLMGTLRVGTGIGAPPPFLTWLGPSTSSAAASPAKTSASPDAAQDSKPAPAATSSSSSPGSPMSLFGPEGMSSLRTYPDYFPAKADEISPSYSRRWPSSGFTTSPGVCWTADISECPSGGGVSSCLADVLQDSVAPKYFLSPRAAAGILRRAEKRGRELPSHLSAALEAVARTTTTPKADG